MLVLIYMLAGVYVCVRVCWYFVVVIIYKVNMNTLGNWRCWTIVPEEKMSTFVESETINDLYLV